MAKDNNVATNENVNEITNENSKAVTLEAKADKKGTAANVAAATPEVAVGAPVVAEAMNSAVSAAVKAVASAHEMKAEDSAAASEAASGAGKVEGDAPRNDGVADSFTGLPIESLICKPIVAAAQAQQELTAVYIDGIKKLAYNDQDKTNTLDFSYNRPIIKQDGSVDSQEYTISAPVLSLVPLPAFTMDELTVDFNMEVKDMNLSDSKTHADASTTVKYNSWFGLDASITGNVSSDTEHKRQTDSTATYKIHARAVQQPPSEGMAKLTSLFAQAMEPIGVSKKS